MLLHAWLPMQDAQSYLEGALVVDPMDAESTQKLEECQRWLAYVRSVTITTTTSSSSGTTL